MPTPDMPAEPCRLEKCRSSRAGVKTAERLACPVRSGRIRFQRGRFFRPRWPL